MKYAVVTLKWAVIKDNVEILLRVIPINDVKLTGGVVVVVVSG